MFQHLAEMYKSSMNTAVLPCENYYEYVCANYPIHNQIPPHLGLISSFYVREQNVDRIISDYVKKINLLWPKGYQKVRTFYELCMNEDQQRLIGYDTLEQELATIGLNLLPPFHSNTEPRNDFAIILGKIHRFSLRASSFLDRVNVRPFQLKIRLNTLIIGSSSEQVAHGINMDCYAFVITNINKAITNTFKAIYTTTNTTNVNSSAISNRADYSGMSSGSEESRPVFPRENQYITEYNERYMISVVNALYDHLNYKLTDDMKREIKRRVDDVLALQGALIQMAKSFNMGNVRTSNRFLMPHEVKSLINGILEGGEIQINFNEYLETLYSGFSSPDVPSMKHILDDEDFALMISLSPFEEFVQTYAIIRNTRASVFESLIWWTVVESILEEGPAELYQFRKGYKATLLKIFGPPSSPSRDIRCMLELRTYFGNFVGHVLAKKTNGRQKKTQVTEMFENIKSSFEESIRRTSWADDETKEATLEKIRSMTAYIAFDDSLLESKTIDREYRKIDIEPGNYYKVIAALYRQRREKELFKLLILNDFDVKPEINPASFIGAAYIREYNYVVIPIADIQFPRWDLGLEVLHYAALGHVVAHEIGHSIDKTGSTYNARGDRNHCLTDHAAKAYSEIVDCFIESFNNLFVYVPEQGFFQVNGRVSVDENMADWQGYNIGLMAYKKYEEKHGVEQKLPDIMFSEFTPEELYSLAFSNVFCANMRPNHLLRSATSLSHATDSARVNGVLKNSKQFSDAYMCSADAPMNPPKKCEIWF